MAGNLNIAVTADSTQLRAQMALAQAQVKAYAAEIRAAAADIQATGTATAEQITRLEQASAGYNTALNAAARYGEQLRAQVSPAVAGVASAVQAETAAMNQNGVAREAMVLAHELMQGRFTRVGGSLMVMAERMGGASMATMGLVGAFAVAAMGAMRLVEWLDKVGAARLSAEAGALGSGITQKQADDAEASIRALSGVTAEESGKITNAFLRMRGVTAPVLSELVADVHQFAVRSGEDVSGASQKIIAAYSMELGAAQEVMANTRASTKATQDLQDAITHDDPIRARTILLTELARSAHELNTETLQGAEGQRTLNAAIEQEAPGQVAAQSNVGALRSSAEAARQLAAAIASVNTEEKVPAAQSWSEQTGLALQKAVLETERAGLAQHQTWQQVHEAMAQVSVNFWTKELADTREGTKNHEEAERNLYAAQEQLAGMRIRLATKTADEEAKGWESAERTIEGLRRQAAADDLKDITAQNAAGQKQLQARQSMLAEEASDQQLTKVRQIQLAEEAATAEYGTEMKRLTDFIATQDSETEAFKAAKREEEKVAADAAAEMARLHAQEARAAEQSAQAQARSYQQAFTQIGDAGERAIGSYITGQETWRRAEQQVARAVVDEGLSMATHLIASWVALELAKTSTTEAGIATRDAVEAAQEGGGTGMATLLMRWIGLETAKTGQTTLQARIRAMADGSAQFTAELGQLLARWTGLETAKSTATAAGATERATDEGTAAAAALTAIGTAARGEIAAAAAVAAAWAYADSAMLGPVGLAAAPGVAMGAEATVMAFQAAVPALDVGAWDVPSTMLAQIHPGEMVIPAAFAEGMRSAAGGSGAGSSVTTPVIFQISAIDASGVQAFFNKYGRNMAATIAQQISNNPSLRPSY